MIIYVTLILSIVTIILTPVCFFLACMALIKIIAMEKSTHSVQYVPVDEEINKANEEYLKKEKWATSEEAIAKQRKLYQEDLEAEMPEFALDDEDKEIFSI